MTDFICSFVNDSVPKYLKIINFHSQTQISHHLFFIDSGSLHLRSSENLLCGFCQNRQLNFVDHQRIFT